MKRVCILSISILFLFCLTISSFAYEDEKCVAITDDYCLFENDSETMSVMDGLDTNQVAAFFEGKNYDIDFSHLMAVYMPLDTSEKSSLSETLQFDCSYVAPVLDNNGKTAGMAKIVKYNGNWVVGVYYEGYDLVNKINKAGGKELKEATFIENPYTHEFALLTVTENAETYISLDSGKFEKISGKEILHNIVSNIESDKGSTSEGSGEPLEFTQIAYISSIAFCAIIALIIGVHIYKKGEQKDEEM